MSGEEKCIVWEVVCRCLGKCPIVRNNKKRMLIFPLFVLGLSQFVVVCLCDLVDIFRLAVGLGAVG